MIAVKVSIDAGYTPKILNILVNGKYYQLAVDYLPEDKHDWLTSVMERHVENICKQIERETLEEIHKSLGTLKSLLEGK